MTEPRRALIMAGGGTKVAFQAGVLQVWLDEAGLEFDLADGAPRGGLAVAVDDTELDPRDRSAAVDQAHAGRVVGREGPRAGRVVEGRTRGGRAQLAARGRRIEIQQVVHCGRQQQCGEQRDPGPLEAGGEAAGGRRA